VTEIDLAYFNYEHGGLRNTGYPGGGADYDYADLVRVMSDGDRWPHILCMGFSDHRAGLHASDLLFYVADMSVALVGHCSGHAVWTSAA
jgi:hypothetical protein